MVNLRQLRFPFAYQDNRMIATKNRAGAGKELLWWDLLDLTLRPDPISADPFV